MSKMNNAARSVQGYIPDLQSIKYQKEKVEEIGFCRGGVFISQKYS